jgi:glycosyltransferase involved in cell wall biosynthesis
VLPLICHVNLARGFRGGERQTELLIRELSEAGVRQRLAGRRGEPLLDRLANAEGVERLAVGGHALGGFRAGRGADLVHAHETHAAHGAFLRHRVSRTPYIITRRVCNVPGSSAFTRGMYEQAACTATVSASVADVMAGYAPGLQTRVIHSATSELPVDPAFVAELRSRVEGRFVVGHVGALDEKTKGQSYIIQAARELADRYPDLLFLFIGGGRDEAMLKSLAADLDNIRFTGFVNNVGDYLSVMDIFMLPSMTEGMGGIVVDAMQFGLPVIATRVGGLPEVVSDGKSGLLIPPADVPALASAIVTLYEDPELRARMGAAGREIAGRFAPARMAEQYLRLYKDVLGRELT